jgi:hypothetical protein
MDCLRPTTDLQQVQHAVLKWAHPEQVAVAVQCADELAQCRGLTSERDGVWSEVGKKAELQ